MKTVNAFVQSEKELFKASVRSFLPRYALVPFCRAKKMDFSCVVAEDDVIKEGQVIASSAVNFGGRPMNIHSSVPGRVSSIEKCYLPDGHVGMAVKIKLGGAFSFLGKSLPQREWQWESPEELMYSISESGIINTFAKPVPLYSQLANCRIQAGRLLIVRMFDEDPSRMTDSFVAKVYTKEVYTGALITARAMRAQGIAFVVPKKSGIELSQEDFPNMPVFLLEADTKKYPAGFAQNLIHQIKKAAARDSVFSSVNHCGIFVDSETMYNVQQSVVFGKPPVENFIHVTGDCLGVSAMFRVRVGATVESLAEQCGGFKKKLGKIIINGMITGSAVSSLQTVITSDVKSVAFMGTTILSDQNFSPCIRCGKCRTICPEGIFPDLMFRHSNGGKPVGQDLLATANLCSGCCLCNSVCPSRLPLFQSIELMRNCHNETN